MSLVHNVHVILISKNGNEMFGHGVYFLVFEHCSTFLRVNRIELATVVEEP